MTKYIDAEKLRELINEKWKELADKNIKAGGGKWDAEISTYLSVLRLIDSLQEEQPDKIITLNGIKYKEVPAKTDDKICKECDYFLDNGECTLDDDCPCSVDNILEKIHKQEKPEMVLEEEINRTYHNGSVADTSDLDHNSYENIARHFAEWGAEHLAGVRKMIEPEKKEGRTDCSSQGEMPNDSLATQSYENIPNALEEAAKKFVGYDMDCDEQRDYEIGIAAFIAGYNLCNEQMMKEAVKGYVNYYEDSGGILMAEAQVGYPYHNGDKVRIIIVKED